MSIPRPTRPHAFVAFILGATLALVGCSDESTVPIATAAMKCDPLSFHGTTTAACLLQAPTARRVKESPRGAGHDWPVHEACDLPRVFDLGGAVYRVKDLIVVDEGEWEGHVISYAYGFLSLEQSITSNFTENIVVRQLLFYAASLDAPLRVGDRIVALFGSPPPEGADGHELLENRGFYQVRLKGSGVVPADGSAGLEMFRLSGYSHAEEVAALKAIYAETASGLPCTSTVDYLSAIAAQSPEAATPTEEPTDPTATVPAGTSTCDESGCTTCDADGTNCVFAPNPYAATPTPE